MVVVFLDNPQCQVPHVAPIGGRILFIALLHLHQIHPTVDRDMTDDKNSRINDASNPYQRSHRPRPQYPPRLAPPIAPPQYGSSPPPHRLKRTETRVFEPVNADPHDQNPHVPNPRVESPTLAAYEDMLQRESRRDVQRVRQFEYQPHRSDVEWNRDPRVFRMRRLRSRVVKTRVRKVLLTAFIAFVTIVVSLILGGLLLLTFLSLVQMIGTFT